MQLRFLPFKQRQSRKKTLLLFSLSVSLVFRFSKCVDNTTSFKVSSSFHVAAIALLWEAFTNVSNKIRISPFTARFLCFTGLLNHASTLCKA